ncbi:MAG: T9SS type A sorting domain-containing protein [Bacteroidetes bacterium]|nr:T9SS type A sorting domain-containing protein [Bacteroidota bacterium]
MKKFFAVLLLFVANLVMAQTEGTHVFDIWPGTKGSVPRYFTIFKNKLYLMASDTNFVANLYCIDATGSLKKISNVNGDMWQAGYSIISDTRHMADVWDDAGKEIALYMPGNNGSTGWELFKYDGVSSSQTLAYEFVPGSQSLDPYYLSKEFIADNDKIYLSCNSMLYMYDIKLNKGFVIDSSVTGIKNITIYKGKVYYSCGTDDVFCYDPYLASVSSVADYGNATNDVQYMVVIQGNLYIGVINKGLYQYNGTTAPVKVADYSSYTTSMDKTWPIGEYNGRVYFSCNGTDGVCRLCEFDPVTKNVKKFSTGLNPSSFAVCDGKLYFSACDAYPNYELWSYNGITNPKLEVELMPGSNVGGEPFYITSYNHALYFDAQCSNGFELIRYTPNPGLWSSGISNVFFSGKVKVYPNPTVGSCNIQLSLENAQSIQCDLFDVSGKMVYNSPQSDYPKGVSTIDISMANLQPGVYYLRLSDVAGKLLYADKVLKH